VIHVDTSPINMDTMTVVQDVCILPISKSRPKGQVKGGFLNVSGVIGLVLERLSYVCTTLGAFVCFAPERTSSKLLTSTANSMHTHDRELARAYSATLAPLQ
jgi:hypothetical protein